MFMNNCHYTAGKRLDTQVFQPYPQYPHSRQSQKSRQQLGVIRRSQSRHRIPPRYSRKPSRPTALIPPTRDIVKRARIRIHRRVDKAHHTLIRRNPLLIDQRNDRSKRWRRCRRPVDQRQRAVHGHDVVCAVGGHVGVAAHRLRVVVLRRGEAGLVGCVVAGYGVGLVGGHCEDVAEAAARVDYCLAGFLGCGGCYEGVGLDLGCADRGNVSIKN